MQRRTKQIVYKYILSCVWDGIQRIPFGLSINGGRLGNNLSVGTDFLLMEYRF